MATSKKPKHYCTQQRLNKLRPNVRTQKPKEAVVYYTLVEHLTVLGINTNTTGVRGIELLTATADASAWHDFDEF